MSNIFDLYNLLNENTLSNDLLAKSFLNETYMFSAIKDLREFNTSVTDATKELYKSLNEATSKSEENAIFAQFFKKYGSVLDKYINEVNTMVDRFSITLDNLVDSNTGLINDPDVLNCNKPVSITVKKYKNLCATKYPNFDPISVYQTEFDYIGKLMQDLGPISTDIAKLETISSVVNAFSNRIKNKWLEKCIENITGEDDCDDITEYAGIVAKLFVDGEEDIVTNKWIIFAKKEEISSSDKYKDCVIGIANKLINDFRSIGSNIGSMFYRNGDNVLAVRSSDKDIENRDYQLNTYGMNQLDIFMKAKTNQVTQMCSLYVIALSTMMDSIIGHITQCIEVLDKVKESCNSCEEEPRKDIPIPSQTKVIVPENDEDYEMPEEDESSDEDEPEFDESKDDEEGSESGDGNDIKDEDGDNLPDEIEEEAPSEPESEEETEEVPEEPVGSPDIKQEAATDFDDSIYLYEYMMYAVDNMIEQEAMLHYVHRDILREATETPDTTNNATGVNVDQLKGDAGLIQKILLAFKNIFLKFQGLYQKVVDKKIEFVKNNKAKLNECKLDIGEGFKVTKYVHNALDNIKVEPLNYESMKQYMNTESDFIKKYYPAISANMAEGISIKEAMRKMVVPNSEDMDTIGRDDLGKIVAFVEGYGKKYESILKDYQDIQRAGTLYKTISDKYKSSSNTNTDSGNTKKTTRKTITKTSINASYYTTSDMYFNEATSAPKPESNEQTNNGDVLKQIRLYFKVMTNISSSKMNFFNMVFNDYFNSINNILKVNKKEGYTNN